MKSLNILISAYACQPHMGSEPGVGWHLVQELAKHHRVWVLTRSSNRAAIEAELAQNAIETLTFLYCDPPGLAQRLPPAQVPHYYLWQVGAYFVAKALLETVNIDLIHHVTYVRYSTPSFLALLPVPFVWGPVGGGEMAPKAFWGDFSRRGQAYEVVRSLVHRAGELDPFTAMTARRSAIVKATTPDTARRLQPLGATNLQVESESGLSTEEIERLSQCSIPAPVPFRFISMARLLHWKGLHLGIQAFASAQLPPDTEYWILGEGPELASLQALAKRHGVGDRVKFLGRLPRAETLQRLGQCHTLVHASLHDSGGWVCLEAMAAGRPVICLDLGGPSVQVTLETGFKIPAHTPAQTIEHLATAMEKLAFNPELCQQMGTAGQQRVQKHFSWEAKGRELSQQYAVLCHEVAPCAS
ncbi:MULTISPECIES: glycosyltransferase [Cyanophyceae]|uniref:glycosyltransferase family 4 protein n=1 Tax=Cyanophyceae TaxID=3028117 RepID=UPI001682A416|nr:MULTISPECIES: glycosyltransferase [Cyanophyceae]MBD1918197.1 glycosyltransferase [Phormidium sp. FACHB-77]MBD2030229.1 glycosyltransferase [Phormidium sp. FACHB-322]MBD2051399.1 glycosyltransferase [Leptolyngbya sp. FACHB-60]